MWFPKSPAHSDSKSVLDFIPSFNKAKYMEYTILGWQKYAFIYYHTITSYSNWQVCLLLIFTSFGSKYIKNQLEHEYQLFIASVVHGVSYRGGQLSIFQFLQVAGFGGTVISYWSVLIFILVYCTEWPNNN